MDRQMAVIVFVLGAILAVCVALMVYAITHPSGLGLRTQYPESRPAVGVFTTPSDR